MDREWQRQIHNDGPLQCSTLTLCLAIVAAAFLIIIPPAGAAASYTKAQWGVEWALIQAESKDGKLPTLVSIGMFRVCYSSPRTACLAFQWGLEIDRNSFQGSAGWAEVLPPSLYTKTWGVLSFAAFGVTFVAAFAYCRCAPEPFVWTLSIAAFFVDLSYFSLTAVIFFYIRAKITSRTQYTPKPVLLTGVIYVTSVALLVGVAGFTCFHNRGRFSWKRNRYGSGKSITIERKEEEYETQLKALGVQALVEQIKGQVRGDGGLKNLGLTDEEILEGKKEGFDVKELMVKLLSRRGNAKVADNEHEAYQTRENDWPNPYLKDPKMKTEIENILTKRRNVQRAEDPNATGTIHEDDVQKQMEVIKNGKKKRFRPFKNAVQFVMRARREAKKLQAPNDTAATSVTSSQPNSTAASSALTRKLTLRSSPPLRPQRQPTIASQPQNSAWTGQSRDAPGVPAPPVQVPSRSAAKALNHWPISTHVPARLKDIVDQQVSSTTQARNYGSDAARPSQESSVPSTSAHGTKPLQRSATAPAPGPVKSSSKVKATGKAVNFAASSSPSPSSLPPAIAPQSSVSENATKPKGILKSMVKQVANQAAQAGSGTTTGRTPEPAQGASLGPTLLPLPPRLSPFDVDLSRVQRSNTVK